MPGSGHNEIHYSAKCAIYDYILHVYRDFRPSTKWLDFANDLFCTMIFFRNFSKVQKGPIRQFVLFEHTSIIIPKCFLVLVILSLISPYLFD